MIATMPTNAELEEMVRDSREHIADLYRSLQKSLQEGRIEDAFQEADDLALHFADECRFERLAQRRGMTVEAWPEREIYDEAADLAIASVLHNGRVSEEK